MLSSPGWPPVLPSSSSSDDYPGSCMEGVNSSSSGQHADHGCHQGGPKHGHCGCCACCCTGRVYSDGWSPSPLPVQHADTPILPVLYCGITELIPVEDMVVELHCSPGIEFVKGSSKGKVEGTPEYVPTSPLVDWNAVADEIAVGPDGGDSLDEDSLDGLAMGDWLD